MSELGTDWTGRGYTTKLLVPSRYQRLDGTGTPGSNFNKLQASSRTEAVMRAVSLGWLPPDLVEPND
jgi:hypothetical protein